MPKSKKISIIIPCYNEETGLPKVLDSIPHDELNSLGYTTEIIVIDNNSTDNTSNVAKRPGVQVIFEKVQGKGAALRTGFKNIAPDSDYVVMLDGDHTYSPREIPRLIEPLRNDFADVILGSRLEGRLHGKALSQSHRIANWFFTFFVRRFYQANVTDVCTGFFAWKADVVRNLAQHVKSKGFAIETEMVTKMAKMNYNIFSVPITYSPREGTSKIAPISDGLKIVSMLIKNLSWSPEQVLNER